MQKRQSPSTGLQTVTKVRQENVPPCYLSFHRVDVSFDETEKHLREMVSKMLSQMGYDGRDLGING